MAAKKFCFCLKLENGCVLLGFLTFLLSLMKLIVVILMIVFLEVDGCFTLEAGHGANTSTAVPYINISNHPKDTFHLTICTPVIEVLSAFAMIFLFLWMLFSVLLIIGILKKNVSFVMTYFLYGITISIIYLLSGLLEALGGLWAPSVVTFVLTLVYIKCLVSVYVAYDKMRQATVSDLQHLIGNEEPMIECIYSIS